MKNLKKLIMITVAMTLMMLPVLASRASAASVDIATTTFYISKLGDLTLVAKEGVPQTIVVRGKNLTGKDVGFSINGTPYIGYVLLTNNLTLLPGTMPLKFEHNGVVELTFGDNMLVLMYEGTATATKDVGMLTKTLNSYGEVIFAKGTGALAALNGIKGTYTLTLVCHIVPGEHPMVGSPVEVTFSAMGM